MLKEYNVVFTNREEALDLFTYLLKPDPAMPRPPLPLIALIGPSGSGKSTLIDYLRNTHCLSQEGQVIQPYAFLDFTLLPAPRTLLDTLISLRDQLQGPRDATGRHLSFPRFDLGASIATAFAIRSALPAWSEEQLQERLSAVQPLFATVDEAGTSLETLRSHIPLLLSSLKAVEHLPLVHTIVEQFASDPAWNWYRSRDELELNTDASPEAVLERLYTMSIPRTPGREHFVEDLLPAAFVADIRDAFDGPGSSRAWGETTCATLFLDGYETLLTPSGGLGSQLLEALIGSDRRRRGAVDPLLVVLGSRNHPMADYTGEQEPASSVRAQYNGWVERLSRSTEDSSHLRDRYFPVILNAFTQEDSYQLLSQLARKRSLDGTFMDQLGERFVRAIQRATKGLPLYVALAAESVLEASQRGQQVGPEEFDQVNTASEAVTADQDSERGDALLTLLLRQLPEAERWHLLFCAAPRSLSIEMLSVEAAVPGQDPANQRWKESTHFPFFRSFKGGRIVLHPLMRVFLLKRSLLLPDAFTLIHTRLRVYFAQAARNGDDHAWIEEAYHALALGDSEPAVSLALRILREKLSLWENLLEAVAQAPTLLMPSDVEQRATEALSGVKRNHYMRDGITAVILYTWLLSTTRHGSVEAASMWHKLGLAYYGLLGGDRQANLQAAIACYNTALEVYGRERFPAEWASLQHDLGTAFRSLPSMDRESALHTSTVYFQAALEVFTRDRFPIEWATTQHDLGFSYCLWPSDDRQDVLLKAIGYYSAALEVLTPEGTPAEWAETQNSLGIAYRDLPRGDRQDNQRRAMASFQQALQIYTYEEYPFGWADATHHLGITYTDLPGENRREYLKKAISCFQDALRVRNRYDHPDEWGFTQQQLAVAYHHLPGDDYEVNQQKAITSFNDALEVYTREDYPIQWAIVQACLSILYHELQYGDRRANLQMALEHKQNELQVFTRRNFPTYWAEGQISLAVIRREMADENDQVNIHAAVMHFEAARAIFTRRKYPLEWADIQRELGITYRDLGGQDQLAAKKALTCFKAALRVYTRRMYPVVWAAIQRELGTAYRIVGGGDHQANSAEALACYQRALRVWKLDAFPDDYRTVQIDCAETEAEQGNWAAAHEAYTAALQAEDLLITLGAGIPSYDVVLMKGRDAAVRDGFALLRLGKFAEAAVAIERGRTRWLSDAMTLNAADPYLISDPLRRERYLAAHKTLFDAQKALHDTSASGLDESVRRRIRVERAAAYRNAKEAFDVIIEEIRAERDPKGFLYETFDANAILNVTERMGEGHALVYLAPTPWGGIALAALSASAGGQTSPRFLAHEFPSLSDALVENLIETHLGTRKGHIIGGFDCAQQNNAYELLQRWPGGTFRERATALHQACAAAGGTGSLDAAALQILSATDPELVPLIDRPVIALSQGERELLAGTFNHWVLHYELLHCQERLAEAVMLPLLTWLREEGAARLTIIPCGALAAFPLMAIPLVDGRTVAETLPGSIAPCARVLMGEGSQLLAQRREGIGVLGNPLSTHEQLEYGEAEALTLAAFGRQLRLPTVVKVRETATRRAFIDVLQTNYVVGASCHGIFDTKEVLHSHLLLAFNEQVTLGDILSGEYDLRGLRLLILSSCQTAILDIRGARNEVRSLTAGMLQAGARAVLSALWAVDDLATYLLIVRFAQEWFPRMEQEAPAQALSRAQYWLRTVTYRQLQDWTSDLPVAITLSANPHAGGSRRVRVRGRGYRLLIREAEVAIRRKSRLHPHPDTQPYADPYYWAGFQINGW